MDFVVTDTTVWGAYHCDVPDPIYPGSGGNGGIILWKRYHDEFVDDIVADTTSNGYGFPQGNQTLRNKFFDQQMKRTLAHELGHVLSIDHHCPSENGNWNCVIKYDDPQNDYPHNPSPHWSTWLDSYGTSYMRDNHNCYVQRALRPVDATHWP